ncbi:hypothetical protein NEMBOFW57_002795 [Staphylotrichum longicolle]|uniref:MATE efflux family protein n=1 Tax=Staphylotrichum longicolle TaxID=669026 RepID=A0AAD4F452_9PEZI|nr:hypothetical protein NEMBOFW57_002795 [Staphylotrichum longicolle]
MSPALPIDTSKSPYHECILETSTFLSSSYLSSSPIANEILAQDLADFLDDDYDQETSHKHYDDISIFGPISDDAPVSHGPSLVSRPNGVAYGTLRPIVATEAAGSPALNARDLDETCNAERSLLRDNHILPPKHPRPLAEPLWKQIYRRCFSTKLPPPITNITNTDNGPLLSAREAQTLSRYARPLILTFLLHYSVTVTSVFTVGRLGRLELGAVSLATMTANVTCYAPLQGLATCLDTLCAQAYGSGQRGLVGLQLQRVTWLLWVLVLPVAAGWWWAGGVLAWVVPDGETAALAGVYLRVLILGTPGVAAFESGKRFVQAQGLFRRRRPMIQLALPGMIMVEAQYFAFEVLTLASSQFGSSYLAAQSIVVTLTSITFNIPFPLSIAASTRVANLIGARLSNAARTSGKVALVASCLVGLLNLTLLGSLRFKLPLLFTKDQEVAAIVSHVLPVCAVLQLFDSLAAVSHGLLRGIGRQGIGGYTNLFSYYFIALPISFAIGWGLGWRLEGLWFGIAVGLAV